MTVQEDRMSRRSGHRLHGREVGVLGALLLAVFLLDRLVLLPGFEAGRGETGVAVAAWLLVNLAPALTAAGIARASGAPWGAVLLHAALVTALTGLVIVLAVYLYMLAGAEYFT